MENRVEEILREIMELDDDLVLTDDMSAESLEEWDSLASMQIVLTLEKEYAVKFDYEEIISMETIGDIKRVLANKLEKKE
ncbi:MAG: acyl carrier protein [Lachnospiraceae bacterium]|nr:acyl carrier protein [Lachnospiraceae bacterium]